jgi:hypothetical protein
MTTAPTTNEMGSPVLPCLATTAGTVLRIRFLVVLVTPDEWAALEPCDGAMPADELPCSLPCSVDAEGLFELPADPATSGLVVDDVDVGADATELPLGGGVDPCDGGEGVALPEDLDGESEVEVEEGWVEEVVPEPLTTVVVAARSSSGDGKPAGWPAPVSSPKTQPSTLPV